MAILQLAEYINATNNNNNNNNNNDNDDTTTTTANHNKNSYYIYTYISVAPIQICSKHFTKAKELKRKVLRDKNYRIQLRII